MVRQRTTFQGIYYNVFGSSAEYELMKILWGYGFAVAKCIDTVEFPAPDVLAIKGNIKIAFEVKRTSNIENGVRVRLSQLYRLLKFSELAGAIAYVAVNVVNKNNVSKWFVIPVEALTHKIRFEAKSNKTITITKNRLSKYGFELKKLL